MIIDFHTHCYPDKLAPKAVSIVPRGLPSPVYDGTLKGLKSAMKLSGIDLSVVMHIANKPEYTRQVNDWAILCNQESDVLSFGSIHPLYQGFKEEIVRLKDAGVKGLKFHPYYQKFDINCPEAYPLYEAAASADMIMLFHTGLDPLLPGDFGASDKFAALVEGLGYEKIVGAHLGGSLSLKEAEQLVWGKNIYLDLSLSFRFLDQEQKASLKQQHSIDKLLFASDGPWTGPQEDFKQIDSFFDSKERELIYYKNAARLLNI